MKKHPFFRITLLVIAILWLSLSPVTLHAQQLFAMSQNGLSKEKVVQLQSEIKNQKSKIFPLSLTKNNENKNVYPIKLSSGKNTQIIILNEQTGNHVVIIPVKEFYTELQLSPFFIEELKQGVLGEAERYIIVETQCIASLQPDYSITSVSSVSVSNGEVYLPRYFYGIKENVQEALPQNRQVIAVLKAKPQFIPAFPDDLELKSRLAQLEEEMS
jgi:hypothetical protein